MKAHVVFEILTALFCFSALAQDLSAPRCDIKVKKSLNYNYDNDTPSGNRSVTCSGGVTVLVYTMGYTYSGRVLQNALGGRGYICYDSIKAATEAGNALLQEYISRGFCAKADQGRE